MREEETHKKKISRRETVNRRRRKEKKGKTGSLKNEVDHVFKPVSVMSSWYLSIAGASIDSGAGTYMLVHRHPYRLCSLRMDTQHCHHQKQ